MRIPNAPNQSPGLRRTRRSPGGSVLPAGAVLAVVLLSSLACFDSDKTPEPSPTTASGTPSAGQIVADAGLGSIGDSYYWNLGNGGYDVLHYTIDLIVDMETGVVTETAVIEAEATQDLGSFNLDYDGPEIDSVVVDGATASYERTDHELTVVPQSPLESGDAFEVTVTYSGIPETTENYAGLSIDIGWIVDENGVYVLSEPNGAATWYPVNDHPRDKATYTFRVTVAEPYVVAANGLLQETIGDPEPGWGTYVWEASDPTANYL
ncbi:MAG: hypothetical protein E3J64_08135, partial [Anaerolineales bacterium]